MLKDEPEVRRAKARSYAAWCNKSVSHPYPNIYIALEIAEQVYIAAGLPYEPGGSKMDLYPPERFTWFCDDTSDAETCLKFRDNQTGRVAVWPHF
jgi:hypothetical protein